jgi:hypothetical protein
MFGHPLLNLAYGNLVFVDTPEFDDSMPKSGQDVLRVDTPEFDDSMTRSGEDVLKKVDRWLKSTYVFVSVITFNAG